MRNIKYIIRDNMLFKCFIICIVYIFACILCCFSTNINVEAALSEDEGRKLLEEINSSMNRSAEYETLMSILGALKTSGFSDYECAAILVNMNRESSLKPDACQNSSWTGGVGLIQWDDRKDALEKWSRENCKPEDQITIHGSHVIGCIGCQVAYILTEFEQGQFDCGNAPLGEGRIGSYNDPNEIIAQVNDSSIDLYNRVTLEQWRAMKNPVAMSLYFTSQFERCAFDIDIYQEGAKQSPEMYKLISGTDITSAPMDEGVSEQIALSMVNAGLWSEEEFVSYTGLAELSIEMPDREGLSYKELNEISNWSKTLELKAEDTSHQIPRSVFMFIGILIVIYSVLLYLAYQFDMVNNFIDIELLGVFTFRRLRASVDETSNYSDHSAKNKVVTHKNMIIISLSGIAIGVLLISGKLYELVFTFVRWITSVLGG